MYNLAYNDFRGKLREHYLIFGEINYIESLIKEIRNNTNKPICYVCAVKKIIKLKIKLSLFIYHNNLLLF